MWGPPKTYPPGRPKTPFTLFAPDQPGTNCSGCVPLKLTYNPNTEPQADFHCDQPLAWGEADSSGHLVNPVSIEQGNRCHLFCDKVRPYSLRISHHKCYLQMLISITECKAGAVWTGRPDLGLWCNTQQPALTSRRC